MPQYDYVAMDSKGREKKSTIKAPSEEVALQELKKKGLFPTSIKPAVTSKPAPKKAKSSGGSLNISFGPLIIPHKELIILTRQLAILLDAGLPLIRALRTLERQARNPSVRGVLGKIAAAVEGGATFAEALSQHPKSFDKLYLNMVRAGEASGAMETILDRLAGFMEKAARIASKVKSAMIYPIVVLSISLAAVVGLMVFIVPNFSKIFADLLPGEPLPAITEFFINISNTLISRWHIYLITIASIIVFFKLFGKIPFGKYILDYLKYHMPIFGSIISKTAVSRFSRTLGTLMASGVPVLNALAIVKDTSGNEVVAKAITKVHAAVKEGEGIANPLGKTKVFEAMVISMVEVGEETGKLPEMLTKIADTYEDEVDNKVGALTSLIEPLMIVALAGIVGTIVVALFMPLVKIIEKMS
ncbi:MAG: type II secretion system F family protein [Victivallaceae bacterium]|nr:type II secretion system F family protein [Victivallaceae bacterium]